MDFKAQGRNLIPYHFYGYSLQKTGSCLRRSVPWGCFVEKNPTQLIDSENFSSADCGVPWACFAEKGRRPSPASPKSPSPTSGESRADSRTTARVAPWIPALRLRLGRPSRTPINGLVSPKKKDSNELPHSNLSEDCHPPYEAPPCLLTLRAACASRRKGLP